MCKKTTLIVISVLLFMSVSSTPGDASTLSTLHTLSVNIWMQPSPPSGTPGSQAGSISSTTQTDAIDFFTWGFNRAASELTSTEEPPPDECSAGVADGEVTIDGRPLLWKLRNERDETNDIHYFASGVQHYPGHGPALYSYLGMGPAHDLPEGPVRQGLNSQGLAVGWNVLDSSGWEQLNQQALGNFNIIDQVRTYLNAMTNLSTYNYFIDSGGQAVLWESQTSPSQHWEYNTRASARDNQWIDVDNADGDNNYATGTDVSLSGWIVRANGPGQYTPDGSDDLGNNADRYRVGRTVIGSLIYNDGDETALSAKNLATNFFRNGSLAIDNTVSNMIVQGVLPTEDTRLSTMWVLLGHSETGIFVPVWLHGVESGGESEVPQFLDFGDDEINDYAPAKGMHNLHFDHSSVQARTLPFEEHLFDVVNTRLLLDWRNRDWSNDVVVAEIGVEMKRVQEQMDADAYHLLKYLFDHGDTSNHAPTVSIDSVSYNELEATFSVTTGDADGDTLTYLINYGDGQTGTNMAHLYAQDGHYLVSYTVTDQHGCSQTDWLFVTVQSTGNVPGAFARTAPADAAMGVLLTPTLTWTDSSGAASYEYCCATSDKDGCTSWTSSGPSTSVNLNGLSYSTTYYWQVRAVNVYGITDADGDTWWTFTTINLHRFFLPLVIK